MKLRNKVILAIIPLILITIILINLSFGLFLQNFILEHEKSQVNSINETVSLYVSEKKDKYISTVNDWSHWDDTYDFVSNKYSQYLKENLMDDTFTNLDLSFIIYLNNDDLIIHKQFYDFDSEMTTNFPTDFFYNFDNAIKFSKLEDDFFGIYKLGNDYYFIATSDITDSEFTKRANGKMIIGRMIDQNIVANIEKITGCSLNSVSYYSDIIDNMPDEAEGSILHSSSINENGDSLSIEMLILNEYDINSSIMLTSTKTRDLYNVGMKNVQSFAFYNTVGFIIIVLIIFAFLGIYLSKPFVSLINDVRGIDLTKEKLIKISEKGQDEFSYLRKSINSMLEIIEAEQLEVHNSEEKLSLERNKYLQTLRSIGDGVLVADMNGNIEMLNHVAEKLIGWTIAEAFGKHYKEVLVLSHEQDGMTIKDPIENVFATDHIQNMENHTVLTSKDGTRYNFEDSAAPIKDDTDKTVGVVMVFRDVTEKKEQRKRIEYLSFHDSLTGLYNRRFAEEEMLRLDTERNLPISIIIGDANGLKLTNDIFGHTYGDILLEKVAEVLRRVCRADDIIARWGGDEFILLLPNTDFDEAERITNRIKKELSNEKIKSIKGSISMGADTKAHITDSIEHTLNNAEERMYLSKTLERKEMQSNVIKLIMETLHENSSREKDHSFNVSRLCGAVGRELKLSKLDIRKLKSAGCFHDIGKIALAPELLYKNDKLNNQELVEMKKHAMVGYRILNSFDDTADLADAVLLHHEQWDGNGYPKGLKGEEIPLHARIISIVENYDRMIYDSYGKESMSSFDAIQAIRENAGIKFDPQIVEVFANVIETKQ
ncbi:MAG: HD domain-containing phosphohydrolase [Sedimentibacter sp.]